MSQESRGKSAPERYFWIDLEMTGLDEKVHKILEVGVVITNRKFEALDEYHRIVFQPQEELDAMDDWCKKTHGESGLTQAVKNGTPLHVVEKELVELCKKHFASNERIVLAGNSVGQDRRFIDAYMGQFAKLLHYRIIDVSSFKEIFKTSYGLEFKKQKSNHRAIDDIQQSINELRFFLSYLKIEASL